MGTPSERARLFKDWCCGEKRCKGGGKVKVRMVFIGGPIDGRIEERVLEEGGCGVIPLPSTDDPPERAAWPYATYAEVMAARGWWRDHRGSDPDRDNRMMIRVFRHEPGLAAAESGVNAAEAAGKGA